LVEKLKADKGNSVKLAPQEVRPMPQSSKASGDPRITLSNYHQKQPDIFIPQIYSKNID
jgi:hypothetical protein